MLSPNTSIWTDEVRKTLESYDESLLRKVAARLVKPRTQLAAEELIERSLQALVNPAVVDRRLGDLEPPCQQLLQFVAASRQPRWRMGSLLEMLTVAGCEPQPAQVLDLMEAGFLYPVREQKSPSGKLGRLKSFDQWLGQGASTDYLVYAHPDVLARCREGTLPLAPCPGISCKPAVVHESDGLEFALRLAALWQFLRQGPLRATQGGELFKRDLDRMRGDPVLSAAAAENFVELPDGALLWLALGRELGIVEEFESESRAKALGEGWDTPLADWLVTLWKALLQVTAWNPHEGQASERTSSYPFASAYLLLLRILLDLKAGDWARPEDMTAWLQAHHPYWRDPEARPSQAPSWVPTFLLGIAYPLKLIQAARDDKGNWLVRLSDVGRWLLGSSSQPPGPPAFPQTLLVQPNLEIIAFRQGLTPALIARLSQFASWKNLGAACTLQLGAESIYHGLESGLSFESLLQTLEQHGTRALPASVVESLRTWANKRERLTVYTSATLMEFSSAEDANEVLARGIVGARISDRLLVVAGDLPIEDLRHFRVSGNRDWASPPEKCVSVESDGVTLVVDLAKSDLLLETQVLRFAVPLDEPGQANTRRYRLTLESLGAARETGLGSRELDEWFFQRTGMGLSPASRLLLEGSASPPVALRQRLVLHVGSEDTAEGLLQWPETRGFIEERLGPTALAIAEESWPALQERLQAMGIKVENRPDAGPGGG